eukprot:gene3581-biopygen532
MFACVLVVVALLALISKHVYGQYTLTVLAGTGISGNSGDNGPATSAKTNKGAGIWVDSSGVTFFADNTACVIRRVGTDGIITTIGGTGTSSVSNSGGAFTSVALSNPWGLVGDSSFLYISDNYHIWKYQRSSGIVSILAGTGTQGTAGNGGPATSAQVNQPKGLWLNSDNSLYFAEYASYSVRKIDLGTNIISTVAGGGGLGNSGDGGPAVSTNTRFTFPYGVYIDTNGVIFIAATSIRYIVNGIINTYVGGGPSSNTADGFVGTNAYFNTPVDVKGDTTGNIFVVELSKVRVVDYSTKAVTTYLSSGLSNARGIWLDHVNGRSMIAMQSYIKTTLSFGSPVATASPTTAPTVLQSKTPTAIPTAFASTTPTTAPISPSQPSSRPSGQPTLSPTAPTFRPTRAPSSSPTIKNDDVVKVSGTSRVKFVNGQTLNQVSLATLVSAFQNISENAQSTEITSTVLVVESSPQSVRRGRVISMSMFVSGQAIPNQPSYIYDIGFLSTYVMTYHAGYSSSELAALKTTKVRQAIEAGELENALRSLAQAQNATQLLNGSCTLLALISKYVDGQYTLTVFAGTGTVGNSGDNVPATSAKINKAAGIWVDSNGVTFFADNGASVIRRVGTDGIITTIGGTGTSSISNSGGAFTSVALSNPWGIVGDSSFLYISDDYHIWKYQQSSGIVSILAGTGSQGTAGNGGPATSAQIYQARGLWLNSDNSLYFAEYGSQLVRKINLSTNIISTVAGGGGTGNSGNIGDGGPAASTNTKFTFPYGIYIDTNGVIFIAATRIRYIVNGIINTYAGGGPGSNTADGFIGTNAYFNTPVDVKGDTMGNIFVVEGSKVRVVDYSTRAVTTFISSGVGGARGIWLDNLNGRAMIAAQGYVKSFGSPAATASPTTAPTVLRSNTPTAIPTVVPTATPTFLSPSQPSSRPSGQPTLSPTAPTFKPTRAPSSSPTVKNDDVVKVSGTSRVKFVNGQTLNQVSLATLVSAFQNISENAQSTEITSTVLVVESSPQSVRRGRVTSMSNSVSGQALPNQPSYIYDIGFLSTYVMTYHAGYSSSELAALKTTKVRQAIEAGELENALRSLAQAQNATQLLNGSCTLLALISKYVDGQYTLTVFAGTGTVGNSGDNVPATSAKINKAAGIWVDSNGVTFFADNGASVIRRVGTDGIITTIGGTGTSSISNSGGAFTSVALSNPWGIVGDSSFLYISDDYHIWKYQQSSGIVSILAGTGSQGTAGNGGPATSAQIYQARGLWLNSDNSLYFAEYGSQLVRKINLSTNIISTVAGGGGTGNSGNIGDGGPAASTNTKFTFPYGIYIDTNGVIFIAATRIRYIVNGIINTYAGGGPGSNTADGFIGTNAYFNTPVDVKGDTMGNIFVVEGSKVRVVDYSTKAVTTYLSSGVGGGRGIWLDNLNGRSMIAMQGYVKTTLSFVNPVPTASPTTAPTSPSQPSSRPSALPTLIPTTSSLRPTRVPSFSPTVGNQVPSETPTLDPTSNPSVPITNPTFSPSVVPSNQPSSRPSGQPTLSPTAPTFRPTRAPSSSPTLKNDDVVKVSGTSRVKFVNGQTLNQVSLATLVSAFQNISENAQSTEITSTVLVVESSPQSVRRGRVTSMSNSVSGQALPNQPSYIYDIGFLSTYVMTYHAGYSSSELAALKTTKVRQAIEAGELENALRSLAQAQNATQLLNGSCSEG